MQIFYDKNRNADTSWQYVGMGGSSGNGYIKVENFNEFENNFRTNHYRTQSNNGFDSGTFEIIAAEKVGLIKKYERIDNGFNDSKSYTLKLIGAKIESNYYGKILPPEINSFKVNENQLALNLSNENYKLYDVVYFYNFDSTAQGYIIFDSIKVEGLAISKTFPPNEYSIRISAKTIDGYTTAVSKLINFKIDAVTMEPLKSFYVYHNYPNPVNGITNIRYKLSNPGIVVLEVYNPLGEILLNMKQFRNVPGFYEFNLNVANFSSGVYLYTVGTGSGKQYSYKMVVLK